MRPDKTVLTALARQFYDDIRFNAANAPTMAVDEDTTRLFNILLRQAREVYPGVSALEGFTDMIPRTIKFKDALVVAGQLHTILRYHSEGSVTPLGDRTPSGMAPFSSRSTSSSSSSSLPKLGKALLGTETPTPGSGETRTTRPITRAEEFEEELYGPNPPKRLNADGTVPFTLEDD